MQFNGAKLGGSVLEGVMISTGGTACEEDGAVENIGGWETES